MEVVLAHKYSYLNKRFVVVLVNRYSGAIW